MLKRIILSRDWWCTSAILALRGVLRQEDHYELVVSLDQNEFKAYMGYAGKVCQKDRGQEGGKKGRERATGIGRKGKGREKGEGKGEKLISQRPEKRQDRALELCSKALQATLCSAHYPMYCKPPCTLQTNLCMVNHPVHCKPPNAL